MSKKWDSINRRRKALEAYLDVVRRECAKVLRPAMYNPDEAQVVRHTFDMARDLSKTPSLREGLDFRSDVADSARSLIQGKENRLWLAEEYGLLYCAIEGQGLAWTMQPAIGYTWEAYRKLQEEESQIDYMEQLTVIMEKRVGPGQKNAFAKLASYWGVLGDQARGIGNSIRAALPPIVRPVMDDDAEDVA